MKQGIFNMLAGAKAIGAKIHTIAEIAFTFYAPDSYFVIGLRQWIVEIEIRIKRIVTCIGQFKLLLLRKLSSKFYLPFFKIYIMGFVIIGYCFLSFRF
jgi:hypothetical protein